MDSLFNYFKKSNTTVNTVIGATGPSGPEIYGVFYTDGENENNIIFELIAISTTIEDAKVLISKKISYENMNNNYTHIGYRGDIKLTEFTGFIIEKLKINELI